MNLLPTMVFVMAGGTLGALARFVSQRMAARYTAMPGWLAICLVNILGSLLIGVAFAWITDDLRQLTVERFSPTTREFDTLALNDLLALLVVGFCGAFTTFSTFSLDNFLLSINRKGQMLLNMVGTTALSFGGVALGWFLGGLAVGS